MVSINYNILWFEKVTDTIGWVYEGDRETRIHSHVNELLEQELDRASSQSVRRTSREYLRVIQGGTASFPRQQAEG